MEAKVESGNFLSSFDEDLAATVGDWAADLFKASGPLRTYLAGVVDLITAGAFLAGAFAAMTGARLALLGAVILVLA